MQSKRLSQSFTASWVDANSVNTNVSNEDSAAWVKAWGAVYARDLIDSRIVSVDAGMSVEDACDILLSEDMLCLAVKASDTTPATSSSTPYVGLFDFSDVNAFLTLAATRHTRPVDEIREDTRADRIVTAARAGRVPVELVSNLSEKNPLQVLPYDATIISLLEVFGRGAHRALIQSLSVSEDYLGMVSDRRLLDWFFSYAKSTPSLEQYLSNPLHTLGLPCLNLHSAVVASMSTSTVLDAMTLMSEEGVSSVAVLDDESGNLLSAVSVTDIGKIVVPSQSNQILSTPLHQFISRIKDSDGVTDGVDKFPVYSVMPSNVLSYTMEKLLATNAHRLFVTKENSDSSSPLLSYSGNLSGIVSIVDILSLFARLAHIPDIDPTRMQRHRRASSASSHSSKSEREQLSRSSSRTSIRRNSSIRTATAPMSGSGGPDTVLR